MVELFVLGATLAVVAGAAAVDAYRRHDAPRALDRWAKARGHRFTPAAPKAGVPSPRAFGTRDDVGFTVDFCRVRGEPRTRISAEPRGRAPRLAIVQRGSFARAFAPAERFVGVPRIDDAYTVRGLDLLNARALLVPRLGALARLDRRDDVRLFGDGGRVTLTWRDVETDPLVLDAALEIATAAAVLERPDAPYR